MTDGPGEGLTPPPEDGGEEAENAKAGEEEEELAREDDRVFVAQEREQIAVVQQAVDGIEMDEFHDGDLVQAQNQPVVNAGEINANPDPDLQPRLDRVVDDAMGAVREQPDARRQWNTQRFIALFSGLAGISTTIGVIYAIIHSETTGEDSGAPVPEEVKKKIRGLVAKWWGRPDADYWHDLAVAADDTTLALTLEDQILFMNYTIDLSPVTPWIWQSTGDIMAVVNQLRTAYATSGSKTSAMYRLAPTLPYRNPATDRDVPLPRPVTATVLRQALSIILIQPSTIPPP